MIKRAKYAEFNFYMIEGTKFGLNTDEMLRHLYVSSTLQDGIMDKEPITISGLKQIKNEFSRKKCNHYQTKNY